MKLPFTNILFLAALFAYSANAYCKDETISISSEKMNYMNLHVGAAFYNKFDALDYDKKKPENGGIFGFGFGRKFNQYISAEANLTRFHDFTFEQNVFSNNPSNSGYITQEFSSTNIGVNLKASAPSIFLGIQPFINIGGGYSLIDAGKITKVSSGIAIENDGSLNGQLSYNLGLGINFPIIDAFKGSVAYQFYDLGSSKTSSISSINTTPSSYTRPYKTKIRANTVLATIEYHY